MCCSAEKLPFPDKAFDITLSVHFLHLIKNWREILKEIFRVTKYYYVTFGQYYIYDGELYKSPYERYEELLRKFKIETKYPGIRERELPDYIKPTIIRTIGPFRRTLSTNRAINYLEKRIYSLQWELDEIIHNRVIKMLKKEYLNRRKYKQKFEIRIIAWDVSSSL